MSERIRLTVLAVVAAGIITIGTGACGSPVTLPDGTEIKCSTRGPSTTDGAPLNCEKTKEGTGVDLPFDLPERPTIPPSK